MAVKDGLPATDFSKMNRDYIRNVAEGETVKDGLPATDFSRMNREYIKAVVEESGGGGGGGGDEMTLPAPEVTLTITSQYYEDIVYIETYLIGKTDDGYEFIVLDRMAEETIVVTGQIAPVSYYIDGKPTGVEWSIFPTASDGNDPLIATLSDAVNGTINGDTFIVTDYTKPCSVTVTFSKS